jgi:hypothetical protein
LPQSVGALALVRLQVPLAQPDRLRRDLHQLVVGDELDGRLEGQLDGRGENDVLVLARRADVGELFLADGVDHQIVVARVDAHDHALVYRLAGADEHTPARLQLEQGVRHQLALLGRDQHAVAPLGHVRLDRAPIVEHVAHHAAAARQVEELALEADQAARRDAVFQPRAPLAVGLHVGQLAAA